MLLGLSAYLFFASSLWLTPLPIMLSLLSLRRRGYIRNTAINSVIKLCVALSEELKHKGLGRRETYKEILRKMLGDSPERCESLTDSLLESETFSRNVMEKIALRRRERRAGGLSDREEDRCTGSGRIKL